MALGPELFFFQAIEVTREFARNKVRRTSAGDSWLVLSFSRDRSLLFSWDSESYGLCRVTPNEVRELESASSSQPPILGAIKSHIVGADLCHASQQGRDRVMKLEFRRIIGAGFFQTRYLIFEACGRYSNIIILDEENSILEAAKHILPDQNRYRVIISGNLYNAPPEVEGVSIDNLRGSDLGDTLTVGGIRGIGKPLIAALKKLPLTSVAETLDFLKNADGKPCYQIIPDSGNYVTVSPSPLPGAAILTSEDSLSASRVTVIRPLIERHVAACRKKISALLASEERANAKKIREYESLATGEGDVERLKSEGRLILENAHEIPYRAADATLVEWTADGPIERKITLNPEKDASGNAEARFAKYKRKKAALVSAATILPKLYKVREELREQRVLLKRNDDWNILSMMLEEFDRPAIGRKTPVKPKNAAKGVVPHKRAEFPEDGAVIFCGLSAKGNRYVTFKLAHADDLWLHAQGIPGSHVILRFGARPDEETTARLTALAASCAVYYSGCGDSGAIRVDYAERKHVRAIQGEGVANVTYKEFKTIIVDSSLWRDYESRSGNP